MLELSFAGWLQCRLATDPDDWREPRGKKGWTFAFGDEPDLDRIIRTENPVAVRKPGPDIGVRITEVKLNGASSPTSPLKDAVLSLLDSPVFEGRNGAIATAAHEPISPIHVAVTAEGVVLDRKEPYDINDPAAVKSHKPTAFNPKSAVVAAATGINDLVQFRSQRLQALESALAKETDANRKVILAARIEHFKPGDMGEAALGFQVTYALKLKGPAIVNDPNKKLGAVVLTSQDWLFNFWIGAWDADALAGYMQGSLLIPTM